MDNNDQVKKNIFTEMEGKVLAFWEANKIFEKSVSKEAPKGEYVFYDGPPFATGTPHYGHLVASLMKDSVPRYWTMNGYSVPRRWGWDCHGLPIENIVEKELGLSSKKEIEEKVGVAEFNRLCRSKVLSYADEWEKTVKRLGRWVDMEYPYRTMDLPFMETIWWNFKQLFDKGLVYKDYRSMHICPRCETTLSQSEVAEGYKDIKDIAVTAKFELVDEPNTFVLAWTTTPWTLPGNVALAVGKDIDYVKVKALDANKRAQSGEIEYQNFIVAKEIFNRIQNRDDTDAIKLAFDLVYVHEVKEGEDVIQGTSVIKEFKGSELVGKKYKPLFDNYFKDEKLENRERGWKIYAADFVNTEDGTGVVHIAPAFGEDDMNLGRQEKLPFIQHVAMDGTFKKEMGEFTGLHVKPKDNVQATDVAILKYLAEKNLLFSKEKYEHSYPYCWRCETPLINYATSSWFIDITKIKDKMLKEAKNINWSPEHIKEGRFGQWLEGARDWSVSRQRFWASCLPIWECKCGERKVLGSLEELYEESDGALTKIILVRHGESENNIKDIISTAIDKYDLTKKGKKQVKEADKKIKKETAGENIVLFSSPVLRARETAEMIAREIKAEVEFSDGLKEMELGSWEGRDEKELSRTDDLRKEYDKIPDDQKWTVKRGGTGESSAEVAERVYSWFKKILKKHAGKTIILVSHGDPVMDLINKIKGRDEKESAKAWAGPEYPKNACVKIFYINNATGLEMDLHKDSLDKISLTCDKCNTGMKRIPDVLDCWFESGSMPYAQWHYPFENKERLDKNFPAQFIAEGIDQTRAWFYYLHAISVGLKGKNAFENAIVNGIVLAEDGKKMSKKLKNYPDPNEILKRHGADALRYYLLTSPVMQAENLNFSEKGVAECLRKINMLLWNVYKFYETYATQITNYKLQITNLSNILDQWIVARLNQLIAEVSGGMEKYDLPRATRPIVSFIDDLSTWYLRRSRDRFKTEGEDKNNALATTKYILENLAKIMAPFTPFIAEQLWQKVSGYNFSNPEKSVHLESFPGVEKVDDKIIDEMQKARDLVEVVLSLRDENNLKIRQPLAWIRPVLDGTIWEPEEQLRNIILDEVNIKKWQENEVRLDDNIKGYGETRNNFECLLNIELTPELLAEGAKRELVRLVNAERKNVGLTIADHVKLYCDPRGEIIKKALTDFGDELKKDVLADELIVGAIPDGKEVLVNNEKAIIKIEKI